MRTTRFYAVLMIMTVHWATHAAIYGALVPQAAAAVIVAEDFNRTDGFNMDSATPDVANLPGGVCKDRISGRRRFLSYVLHWNYGRDR